MSMETGIYGRVSTEEQVKEGYSIRGQVQKLRDYTRIKDWPVHDVYLDEGISGKNITERPAINRLIDDVKSGKVKNVLVFKIDRLTRSTADLIYLVDLFNEYGCAFNSLMESIDTQTASGRMFLKIIGIFAEFERENIAERIILGRERKVSEGYSLCSYISSYGYDRPAGQKIQSINEDEAQVVREIFDWYANQGVSITEIARRLNLRGISTKQDSKWTTPGIRNVLKNTNYVGLVRHHFQDNERAYTMDGQHEPIISQEVFDKANHRLKKNPSISPTKQPMEENYFAGFLVCAQCGYKLYPHNLYRMHKDGTRHHRSRLPSVIVCFAFALPGYRGSSAGRSHRRAHWSQRSGSQCSLVGTGVRRGGFCFRRGRRGREEPCQIGQGVEDLHWGTFLSFRFFTGK